MTEYLFHWFRRGAPGPLPPSIKLQAESHLHGAALALRQFVELGCDITAPLAHVDMTESNGVKQTLLVEEVLDWLKQPTQVEFVHREGLAVLLDKPRSAGARTLPTCSASTQAPLVRHQCSRVLEAELPESTVKLHSRYPKLFGRPDLVAAGLAHRLFDGLSLEGAKVRVAQPRTIDLD